MKRSLSALAEGVFDLLILGGGVTGAGVALDASLRGARVALIDQGDFASGTSGASSKLVHGGLRYLEHFDVYLVHEALRERGRLLANAPHLVVPLRFVIPFRAASRIPGWKWRVGLAFYDLLAGAENIKRSRPRTRDQLLRETPHLSHEGLLGGAEFHDAQMDDARLCLAVLRSATREGACVANYVEARSFVNTGGVLTGVLAVDRLRGDVFAIRARQILNATGPWVDRVCRLAGDTTGPYLRPSKGVHLVVHNPGLRAAYLLLHPIDGRVLFVVPWLDAPCDEESGLMTGTAKLLIGTTDTLCDDAPEQLTVQAEEITYLLAAYNHYFKPKLTNSDVLGSFAGLRPLIRSRSGEPSAMTREYRIFFSPSGLLSVAGGKFTTYRSMAEHVTDIVAARLGLRRPCRTRNFVLDGAPREAWRTFSAKEIRVLSQRFGLSPTAAQHLVRRYGLHAAAVATYSVGNPELARSVVAGEPDPLAEFAYQREQEMAILPADFLLRRTRLGLLRPDLLQTPPSEIAS